MMRLYAGSNPLAAYCAAYCISGHHSGLLDGGRTGDTAGEEMCIRDRCKYVDSVMFCISKGLGAPIGSLVCCSEAFSMKIRDKRKLLGGAMRQAGVIAAPGMYALTHNIERLAEDNANAAYAAEQLKDLKNTKVYGKVMSNIIVLDANGPVSYTHLDVYKRQGRAALHGSRG